MSKNTVAISATGQAIPAGAGTVNKLIVNTHSSGVVSLTDSPGGASGRVILADYTIPSGAQVIDLDLEYHEGVYLTIASGTATVQLSYSPSIN